MYIYIYIEIYIHVYIHIHIYIHTHTYIERQKEREKKRETKRETGTYRNLGTDSAWSFPPRYANLSTCKFASLIPLFFVFRHVVLCV